MAIVKLFKIRSSTYSCQIVLPSGNVVRFVNKKAFSEDKAVEAQLENLVKTKEAGVYIDPDEPTIDTSRLDPQTQVEDKAIAVLAKKHKINPEDLQKLLTDKSVVKDLGTADTKLGAKPQSSAELTTAGASVVTPAGKLSSTLFSGKKS